MKEIGQFGEIRLEEVDLAGEVELRDHLPRGRNDVGATVDPDDPDLRHVHHFRKEEIQRNREIRLAAAAVDDGEGGLVVRGSWFVARGNGDGLADGLQELVDLVVLAAHRGAHLALTVGDADRLQERRRVEGRERQVLDAVVGLHDGDAVHLGRTRDEGVSLLRDAYVQVSLRRHQVEVARALLGDDLLQALRRAVRVEVLHPDVAVVGHLGLELLHAADLHGAQRDLEGLSVAANGLDELHEALAQRARADLLLQRVVKFVSFHIHPSSAKPSLAVRLSARRTPERRPS